MSVPNYPRWRSGIHVAPADDGRWQVRWDFDQVAFLEGPGWREVLFWLTPLLDGSHNVGELRALCSGRSAEANMLAVLARLNGEKFLCNGPPEPLDPTQAWRRALEALGHEVATVQTRLSDTPVVVIGQTPLATYIEAALKANGMTLVSGASNESDPIFASASAAALDRLIASAIPIVVEPDVPSSFIEELNRRAVRCRRPWMIVGAWNRRALVGPIFVPPDTACYECYRRRVDSHRRYLGAYRALEQWRQTQTAPQPSEPVLPAIAQIVAHWAALEMLAYLSGVQPARTVGRVLVYCPQDARTDFETVLKIPWCPVCANARNAGAARQEARLER